MSEIAKTGLEIVKSSAIDTIQKISGHAFQSLDNKKDAVSFFKAQIQKTDGLNDLAKAAYISEASRIIREYKNQHQVVQEALELFSNKNLVELPSRNESSNDTIFRILNEARNVSDLDISMLLSQILAGELEVPNSVPKPIINVFANLSRVQAHQLRFLSFFVGRKRRNNKTYDNPLLILPEIVLPLVVWYRDDSSEIPFIIDETAFLDLQSLSILVYGIPTTYEVFSKFGVSIKLLDEWNETHFEFDTTEKTGETIKLHLGNVRLTSIGSYLYTNFFEDVSLQNYYFDKKKEIALTELLNNIEQHLNDTSSTKLFQVKN